MGRDGLIHIETITSSESSEESVEMMMLNGDEEMIHIQEEEKHDTSLESYLFLRVLLVEADDSSRMIISALLRKCGYRVAAVADGLKAWEILKERPKEIDLVLTEIELPSVPGSSLLTMIMGDAICRQIPVIMMSAQDSVNLVFNCMLGGAADFLVKPIRKNELKNLWQHVWRRQSLQNNGKSSPNASTVQQKVEAIDDNCLTKCSSDSMPPPPKRRKGSSDKGSDAQSSCTKPEMEAESANIQTIGNNSSESNPKGKLSGGRLPNHKEFVDLETHTEDVTIYDETIEDNDEHFEPCREAMDLIGSLDHRHTYNLNDATNKNGYTSPLELSLRITDEITQKNTLNHSSGSAFSWYANSRLEPPFVASVDFCTEAKQHADIIDQVPFQNGGTLNNNYVTPLDGDQVVEVVKAAFSGSGIISVPIPVRGIQCDKFQPLFNTSLTANRQEAIPVDSSEELNHVGCSLEQNAIKMINPTMHGQLPKKMESSENQSGTSSLCNSALSHLNSTECRSDCNESNGNVTPGPIFSGNDKGVLSQEGTRGIDSTNCFNPREAALNKFRLKRKDRCFEKKVRYQSRQRLAEQRPRVKGQFVRQMPS